MASRGTQRMRLATLTGWTSFSSQDLVGPGSYFPLQLQSHNGEKNWNKASIVFCGWRIKRVFQAPARDSSRVRCHGHVANVLASILIFSYISSLFTCGHVSPDEEIEYKKK
jgi:hypothetical protein